MKNKTRLISFIFTALLFNTLNTSFAQEVKGVINSANDGYQNIYIPQEFRAVIGTEVGKLRIKDKNGQDVPYVQRVGQVTEQSFKRVNHSLIKTDSSDILVIENLTKENKQSYTLKVSNSATSKTYSIEGSDDQSNWFSLINKATLNQLQSNTETFAFTTINFPLTNYKYIRIHINNAKFSPIQILSVGEVEVKKNEIMYEKLRNTSFTISENKKDKTTLLEVTKDGRNPFDLISFTIDSRFDYFRSAYLFTKEKVVQERNGKKRKEKDDEIESNFFHFDLLSKQSNTFQHDFSFDTDKFYIVVENDINAPLKIDSITLFQEKLYITAALQKGQNYTLETDGKWPIAIYDINKLNLNLSDILPTVQVEKIELVKDNSNSNQDTEKPNKNNWLLIIGLCAGILVIFYFGRSLLNDMQKNKEN